MNPWAIIPLVSCIAYAALLALILVQVKTRVNKVFALFVLASGTWSFTSFMLTSSLSTSTQYLIFWNGMVITTIPWAIVSCYHFVRVYNNKPGGIGVYLGYAIVLTTLSLSLSGHVVNDAYLADGYLYHDIGPWTLIITGIAMPYSIAAMWMLVRRYRGSIDPTDRNRTMYLMVGWGVLTVYGPINANVPLLALLPTDHLGTLANALIISYAIIKYQLLDIRLVMRTGLAFTVMTILIGSVYAGSILLMRKLFPAQPFYGIILFVSGLVLLLALLARPLRHRIQEQVDRAFHRETYAYRQTLLSFSNKMGNILNLDELANEMLPAISNALCITQARLLLQDIQTSGFTTQFTYPAPEKGLNAELGFNADNPIVAWLTKESSPLNPEQIKSIPQLKGLWKVEKDELTTSNLVLLCPIKSKGKLIGILALGKKQSATLYSTEDIELVMSMASQAGIVIENAQLYAQATARANTDGLTGLYNHRHFHERLEQEIARGSRFGTMFSLIMLDIDLFKTYNDIYGHLAGDQALRKIAEHIKGSIRSLDMAFRYGGEEFTVILPEARLDDAYRVAERIRKTIEAGTGFKAMPLTVSLGIASWPTNGVMREETIVCADAALYRAKQTGRNRTCLFSDVVKSGAFVADVEAETRRGALSIIYALAATVDAKDHYTYGHSKKVSEHSVAIAEALDLPQDRVETIRAAALLHDIGKIGVPDSILKKEGTLTEEEWQPIKVHPQLGVEILRHVTDLVNCLPAILHHHEHYDGMGYPSGLKGDNIPLEARILAIADAYDAITSLRPYHKRLSPQQALNELKRCAGAQFDPELVDTFCNITELTPAKRLEIK